MELIKCVDKEEYIYEKFIEIKKDKYSNEKEILWLEKDNINQHYEFIDNNMTSMIPLVAANSLLCYVIDASKFEHLAEMKSIIEKYRKGALGALPDPELINSLLDLKGNKISKHKNKI